MVADLSLALGSTRCLVNHPLLPGLSIRVYEMVETHVAIWRSDDLTLFECIEWMTWSCGGENDQLHTYGMRHVCMCVPYRMYHCGGLRIGEAMFHILTLAFEWSSLSSFGKESAISVKIAAARLGP